MNGLLVHPFLAQLTLALLHFLWQAALIALLVHVLLDAGRGWTSSARYNVLLIGLLAMASCVPVTMLWIDSPATSAVEQSAAPAADVTPYDVSQRSEIAAPQQASGIATGAWQPWLLAAWMLGVLLLGLRLMLGCLATCWLRRHRSALPPEWQARVARLSGKLGAKARVVFTSHRVSDATAIGLLRPIVLLPASWLLEMPPGVLEAVIAHELAHIRRGDLWVNLLQRLLETLLFYHPAVWWLSRRLRLERELCCDELAVAALGRPVVYASALELVARRRLEGSPLVATAFSGGPTMNLLLRVRNVLGMSQSARQARWWPLGLIALALPAGAVCASLGMLPGSSPAVADDERSPRTLVADREGDDDGERRQGPRDGEEKRQGPRDGEAKKDGPRDGEGQRRHGPRDGEGEHRAGPRDGEERREGPRDGEGHRPRPRDFEGAHDPIRPLMHALQQLREEVMQLRREVDQLRRERGPEGERRGPPPEAGGFGGSRGISPGEFRGPGLREGDGPREGAGPRDGDHREREAQRERDADV